MIFLILPNQLFDIKYLDKTFQYVLWECPHYFKAYNYNKKKLLLHRASMQYYFEYLTSKGFNISYIEFFNKLPPDDYMLFNPLDKLDLLGLPKKCNVIDSPNLLLNSKLMTDYNHKTKKFFFNAFYMWSKKQLNIIPHIKSMDQLNRKRASPGIKVQQPFDKSQSSLKYVNDARKYIDKHFPNNYGHLDDFRYPVTHDDALRWLDHFITNKFNHFGPFQDFVKKDDPYMYHSLLSALMNIGLLCPKDVIARISKVKHKIPLNSYEGFIRQLFWREYQFYCYTFFDFDKKNYFGNKQKLTKHWYTGTLGVEPVDDAIREAFDSGYLHHIKRLMVVGNYMNLCGIHPREGFKWFMEFSCDSYEWVMHQNVYDMVFFVSGGATMRRPYLSSSNYILKMSDYKKGDWCRKWDKAYHSFVQKNKTKLWKYRYYVRIK